jgi:hypothetical protein
MRNNVKKSISRAYSEHLIINKKNSIIVPQPGKYEVHTMPTPEDWASRVQEIINGFPSPHREDILEQWNKWIETNPEQPLYQSWADHASSIDDQEALYTERRVFLKKVTNELRDMEIPLTRWQRVAKTVAAIASVFLVIFLALSRAIRVTE